MFKNISIRHFTRKRGSSIAFNDDFKAQITYEPVNISPESGTLRVRCQLTNIYLSAIIIRYRAYIKHPIMTHWWNWSFSNKLLPIHALHTSYRHIRVISRLVTNMLIFLLHTPRVKHPVTVHSCHIPRLITNFLAFLLKKVMLCSGSPPCASELMPTTTLNNISAIQLGYSMMAHV